MHQTKVESIFKIFYDALDNMRNSMLQQEYEMRDKMDRFELHSKELVSKLKTYSMVEFFHEEETLKK